MPTIWLRRAGEGIGEGVRQRRFASGALFLVRTAFWDGGGDRLSCYQAIWETELLPLTVNV